MDLDVILKEVGQFGRYQVFMTSLLFLSIVYTTYFSIAYVFTAADIPYRCFVPQCEKESTIQYAPSWLSHSVPFKKGVPSKCHRFVPISQNFTESCTSQDFQQNVTETCAKWVFETRENTITKDFRLLCDDNLWKLAAVGTVNSVGQFVGMALYGMFSDRYGRKTVLLTTILCSAVVGVLQSMSTNYNYFVSFEFINAMISSGSYSAIFIMGVEITGPDKRVMAGAIIACSYAIGEVVMGLIAWYITDWRLYLRVLYIPGFLFIFYIWLMPESIRWLIANKKYNQAYGIVETISIVNKRPLSEDTKNKINTLISDSGCVKAAKEESISPHSELKLWKILKSRIMITRIIICSYCWGANAFVYYGLSLNSVSIDGNKYINFILTCFAELPAYIITWLFLDKLGRRVSQSGSLILSCLSLIAFYLVPRSYETLRLLLYLGGKTSITISFTVIYVFASEMYPTYARNSLMGTCSMIARIGSMVAPLAPLVASVIDPSLIFGFVALVGGLLAIGLPETQNTVLPETIEDAENIGKTKKVTNTSTEAPPVKGKY